MTNLARIAELLLHGLSNAEIQEEMKNLKPSSVKVYARRLISEFTPEQRKRMEEARTKRGVRPGVYHQNFSERRVLSSIHIRIGRKLMAKRIKQDLSHTQFCEYYRFSNRVMLSAMEQGYHDFTVTEVIRISELLDITAEALLEPALERVKHAVTDNELLQPDPDTQPDASDQP